MRGNRAFRVLWAARSVSFLGDSLSLVALMLLVAEGTGQALAVAALLLVGDFAPSLLGPVAGAVSDRFDLRRVMVACEVVQGGVVVVIALWMPSLPVLLILVGIRAVAGQVFLPASRAVVPTLVRDEELEKANASLGFGTNAGETAGPLVAAALLPFVGVRGVLLVDAVTFLVSAALLAFLPSRARAAETDGTGLLADARAGVRHLFGDRLLRVAGLGFVAVVLANGIDDVALVFLARDTLGGGDASVGLLLGAVGLGLLAGYAVIGKIGGKVPTTVLLVAGFAVSSAGNLLTGLVWAVAAAFAVQAVRGLGLAAMDVATTTLVQRTVPADLQGRVFGTLYGAVGAAAALSYLGGALLLDVTSPGTALVVAGTCGLLATLVTAVALGRTVTRTGRP